MIDVEADDVAVGVNIDNQPLDNFSGLGPRRAGELDINTVRLRIVMQLHRSFLAKITVEERVVDRLAVVQCYNSQISRSSLTRHHDPAPEAKAAVRLGRAPDRAGMSLHPCELIAERL